MVHKSLRKILREFWTGTSIKGVPRAIKSVSPITRVFWGITTAGCLSMLLYQTITLLVKYYLFLVAINVYDSNLTPHFPDIVVCNQSPYDALDKFNPSYEEYLNHLSNVRAQVATMPSALYANDDGFWTDLRSKRAYMSTQPSFPGTPPLPPNSSFIADCTWFTWNWNPYNTGKGTDCQDAMEILWNPNYYQCYIFNPPSSGLMGVSAILYIDNFPTTLFNSTKMNLAVSLAPGIRLFIYPNNTYPLVYFDGMNISPGTELTIRMEETDVTHLGAPYGPCTSQQTLDPSDPESPLYTEDACMTLCRQQQYVERCNCIVLYEAFTRKQQEAVNFTFCDSKLLNFNEKDVLQQLQYPMCDYFLWGDNSLCDCPIPCAETDYALTTSIANWPNAKNQLAFYDKYIKPKPNIYGNKFDAYGELEARSENMTTTEILDEITSLNLIPSNFIQMNILITRQNYRMNDDLPAVGWETLFSNLGGALNLWMGITILFAAEVVELVFAVMSMYFAQASGDEELEPEGEEEEIDNVTGEVIKHRTSMSMVTSPSSTSIHKDSISVLSGDQKEH